MTTLAALEITDPTQAPTYGDGPLSRWCRRALYDPRDEVFVRLTLKVCAVMSAAMVVLYLRFDWLLVPVYLALWAWYSPPVILMLHCTMHRPFIRRPKWLDRVHPFVMSFFFGIPTGYAEHHLGMHHVEDNMPEDLSSTLRYRRDSFLDFLVYFGRFFFGILVQLTGYLWRKRRTRMAKRALFGELGHLAVIVCALLLSFRFGLVAFLIPTCTVRFLMMVGNWGQHAFVNTARRNDGLANSITCINSGYNQRAFNDGYHVGHHLKASRHWTEMPQDFLDNRERYAQAGVIVFEGLDFFLVSVLLWAGRWSVLAKRFVRLDGKERSDADVIAMLKSRVHPIRVEAWEAMQEPRAGLPA
jgi:fatty acid desaturase